MAEVILLRGFHAPISFWHDTQPDDNNFDRLLGHDTKYKYMRRGMRRCAGTCSH